LPGDVDHYGDLDAKRAILGTAAAHGAPAPGDLFHLFELCARDVSLVLHEFAQGLASLVLGHEFGIFVIGQIEEARLGTQAARGAGLEPGAQAGGIVSLDDRHDLFGVYGHVIIIGHSVSPTKSWCRGGRTRCR
jgi:hypothetical protein